MSTHEIVIIGANMAGVPQAHYLLKHTIPQLEALTSKKFHLTIISPNTSYYWKVAAPRALVSAQAMPADAIVKPISSAFASYPASSWAHVVGKATGIDEQAKTVAVSLNDGGKQTVAYDSLILATGTHYDSPIWTTEYGSEAVTAAHAELQLTLQTAKSIVIAGGGPVGVETTGEVVAAYPKKDITLITGGKTVLPRLGLPKVSAEAERQLTAQGVKILNDVRVKETRKVADNKTTVVYDNGTEVTVDVYINAFAGKAVVDYVPEAWLERGQVKTDKESLRVTAPGAKHVYALGDIHIHSDKQAMSVRDSIGPVGTALAIDVIGSLSEDEKQAAVAKTQQSTGLLAWLSSLFGFGGSKSSNGSPEQKKFKTIANTQLVPIGQRGTGALFGFRVPAWLVYKIKGNNYMIQGVDGQVFGSDFAKA